MYIEKLMQYDWPEDRLKSLIYWSMGQMVLQGNPCSGYCRCVTSTKTFVEAKEIADKLEERRHGN